MKEIAEGTEKAQVKKTAAKTKAKEIDAQTKEIAIEKVSARKQKLWHAAKTFPFISLLLRKKKQKGKHSTVFSVLSAPGALKIEQGRIHGTRCA